MERDDIGRHAPRAGLCADCRFMRLMQSNQGSTFYLCERSTTDEAFLKYPRLPVLQCPGYDLLRATEDRLPDSSS